MTFYGGSALSASGGNDTFVFAAHPGTSSIAGYDASDSLQFSASTFANWQAFASHASQSGANTVIRVDQADTLTLQNVALTSLNQSHDHFA